ncbi:phosphonate monoester hydrolase [Rhodobacteraceae bacterium RKSG542]|uniref:alkaline phosphatase family protein n=1 Tax=Pseudovibrio flavus TaxID=2529854 RepID=UPI0012BD80F6|nr:alkaline phosphatase family protein [Pseudovibrio flavus]MTI17486.1 phosphonate monoester hydrolase [Pseudovibrio flavus]
MAQEKRNVLWIMCDQLRFDYLSCYGHPHLHTPNIGRLASRGVKFNRAYVQSPICGPSRMSFYTGRYVRSHGSTWNGIPLRVGEPTLGDHLQEIGVRNVLIGKTHMRADSEGMERLGIQMDSYIGARVSECGFEVFERDDGLHPDGPYSPNPVYDSYLEEQGYEGPNQWERWANSAEGEDGEILSGWLLGHADKPARVKAEHSETPYMIKRFKDFVETADERPWCVHLSLIKPHWPYIVPAPYHNMYGPEHVAAPVRSEAERQAPHPVFSAFMNERVSKAFSNDETREKVIPAYMGLIKQIDDEIGDLLAFMEEKQLLGNTMIVFTSDHGDYLGDHWLGEKELFHEPSVKVPLIIVDPRSEADASRGSSCDELIEGIDLAPTFVEFFGGTVKPNVLEGRSLLPLLEASEQVKWREFVISEYDYSMRRARLDLDLPVSDCRLAMIMDKRWKYVHAEGFRPMLFDLQEDPDELTDLGDHPDYAGERERMNNALFAWYRRHHTRVTMTDEQIIAASGKELHAGVLIGYTDEEEVAQARREVGLDRDTEPA